MFGNEDRPCAVRALYCDFLQGHMRQMVCAIRIHERQAAQWKPTVANGGNTEKGGHERTGPRSIRDYDVRVQGATTLSMTCGEAYVLSYT